MFPRKVRYGDIVRGLPIKDGTAKAVYASHILEHLTRADFETALRNTWRILIPGGTFRLIMPDLETGAVAYLRRLRNGMLDANDHFMDGIGERRPRNFLTHMRFFFGHGRHYWLWDFASTKTALERSGFQKIRRCKYGDNPDPMFGLVENKDRFVWAVSVECVK